MGIIKGITVDLVVRTQTGTDAFGHPTYSTEIVSVDNVLVTPVSEQEILDALNLHGARVIYQLGIPKGDTHVWEDAEVDFFGQRFHQVGDITEGIEAMIPLDWNKKIRVEKIDV